VAGDERAQSTADAGKRDAGKADAASPRRDAATVEQGQEPTPVAPPEVAPPEVAPPEVVPPEVAPPDASAPEPSTPDAASGAGEKSDKSLPCAVQTILRERCGTCHGSVTQFGAPMSLTNFDELHAASPRAQQPFYAVAQDRVQRTGAGMMPPSGQPPLTSQERDALLAWLAADAPAGDACQDPLPPPPVDAPDAGAPEPEVDCDVSFELRAYGDQGGGFLVPQQDDHYECFYFKADVAPETLATSLTPLLDKTSVLHHWLLFAADNDDESPNGTHRLCDGIHPGAYLMAAWLPGTPALVLPKDVGMEMPGGGSAQFILENHYNNIARQQDLTDDSGVKVCATNKPKTQHAAIHWLGSERITLPPASRGSASATCTPQSQEPVHILGVIPHMHKLGRYVSMVITRKDGSTDKLHEGTFEFESQTYYPKDIVLQPGDRVTTRCDYDNITTGTVTLGEKTSNEMCYMFTLAYPVGSMNTGGDFLNPLTGVPFVQGPNRCML
jgi:Copper type II ascorbate-dependent monooxygenase, C-terminal domain/Copper type II ascorbate-dependent monooxygenase, N-terminal domain